ncbi:MAG: radical SAM protein [Candidatus Electrothrix sp. AW5]|nr:radical SAM protein [Candidatus Electrothrix gigas]
MKLLQLFPPKKIVIIIRPIDQCNLSCVYCNAANTCASRMSYAHLTNLFRQAASVTDTFIRFTWHGGEPLLCGIDFFRWVFETQRAFFDRSRYHFRYENVVQTNALLLDDRWLNLFAEYGATVSVSLDGPDVYTNAYRLHKLSRKNANRVLAQTFAAWHLILQRQRRLVVFCVVHDRNAHKTEELYRFFRDFPVDTVSFNPCYLPDDPKQTNIPPNIYANFLAEMLRLRDDDAGTHRRLSFGVLDHLETFVHTGESKLCFASGQCHDFINIDAAGRIFATCTSRVGVLLGSLDDGSLPRIIRFTQRGPNSQIVALLTHQNHGFGCPKRATDGQDHYLDAVCDMLCDDTYS